MFLSCALIGGDAGVRLTVVLGGMTTNCGGSYAMDVDATDCGCVCVCEGVGVCSVFTVVGVPLVRQG